MRWCAEVEHCTTTSPPSLERDVGAVRFIYGSNYNSPWIAKLKASETINVKSKCQRPEQRAGSVTPRTSWPEALSSCTSRKTKPQTTSSSANWMLEMCQPFLHVCPRNMRSYQVMEEALRGRPDPGAEPVQGACPLGSLCVPLVLWHCRAWRQKGLTAGVSAGSHGVADMREHYRTNWLFPSINRSKINPILFSNWSFEGGLATHQNVSWSSKISRCLVRQVGS